MIFQDPYSSLNPRKTVGQIVGAPLRSTATGRARTRVQELLEGRAEPRALQPLPARVLGRAAAADRRRTRARALAEADRLRRAGIGTRRLDPGAGPQPAAQPAARLQPDVRLHLARPLGDPSDRRPHRRHVPGQDRRARRQRVDLRASEASVHRGAALGGSAATTGGPRADRPHRRRPVPDRPARGLRVPPPLPALPPGALRRRRAEVARARAAQAAACHYPLEKWPMTDDEIRQADGVGPGRPARTSKAPRTSARSPRAPHLRVALFPVRRH